MLNMALIVATNNAYICGWHVCSCANACCIQNPLAAFRCCNHNGCSLIADGMSVGTVNFWTWKMVKFQVLFYILLLCTQSLTPTACDVKHTKEPLYGYHCVAKPNTEITASQKDCVLQCLRKNECHYISHNYGTDQCNLGLDKCESLVPVIGGAVNVFGPPRDTCVHWGSRDESGREPIEVWNDIFNLYLARLLIGDALVVGKFKPFNGNFLVNNGNVDVGPIKEIDYNIEFLTIDPNCTELWIPYTAGELLPDGVISGGHLTDGSTTYVTKVIHDNVLAFGYYNTEFELAYYKQRGLHTTSSMELLVLL